MIVFKDSVWFLEAVIIKDIMVVENVLEQSSRCKSIPSISLSDKE